MRRFTILLALVLTFFGSAGTASAYSFFQGFETDANGWFDSDDYVGYGSASRVASGWNGITSAEGSYHGLFSGNDSAPFTRFDGYHANWPGAWRASASIYLDTNWASGSGFDYSVASSKSNGAHLRDYVFHVAKDVSTGELLVAGSNNTNFTVRQDLETVANHCAITNSGWYTFEHSFYDNGGVLAVDLNLRDSVGSLLFTETRSDASDLISTVVGGNRYGWFTVINAQNGLAVDNTLRDEVPEPGTIALLGIVLVGAGATAVRRRKRS